MISDFKQPAKDWLADALNNLGNFLKDGEDPRFIIAIGGVEIEISLVKIPGEFDRRKIDRRKSVRRKSYSPRSLD